MESISNEDDGVMSAVAPLSGDRIIQRILAVILSSGALIFGAAVSIGIATTIGQGMQARPSAWGMVFAAGGIAWVCGWLAMRLWSGRSIPMWFITTFLCAPPAAVCLARLASGDLEDAAYMGAMFLYMYWQIRSIRDAMKVKKGEVMPEL